MSVQENAPVFAKEDLDKSQKKIKKDLTKRKR